MEASLPVSLFPGIRDRTKMGVFLERTGICFETPDNLSMELMQYQMGGRVYGYFECGYRIERDMSLNAVFSSVQSRS